jgi:hypothetical protein
MSVGFPCLQAEYQAEQERLALLAAANPGEATRQAAVASIAFMYQKPPGYEAAQARDREVEARRAAQVGEGEVGGGGRGKGWKGRGAEGEGGGTGGEGEVGGEGGGYGPTGWVCGSGSVK